MPEEHEDEMLTAAEARLLLGVSRDRMASLIREGALHWEANPLDSRKKMIRRSEVEALLRRAGKSPKEAA